MSTYYRFYLYAKKNKDYIYCGPYNKNGKPLPICGVSGGFSGNILGDYALSRNEDDEIAKKILTELGYSLNKDDYWKSFIYLLNFEDVVSIKDDSLKKAYIHKSIMRDLEIENADYDLTSLMENECDSDMFICQSEYAQLPNENRKDYIYHQWIDADNDLANIRNTLVTIVRAWFLENVDLYNEFEGIDINNLILVVPM